MVHGYIQQCLISLSHQTKDTVMTLRFAGQENSSVHYIIYMKLRND